jgi:dolichyl-phosphate beta-glucosyltransferase
LSEQDVLVSIVIPAYNEERRLGTTLNGWLEFLNPQPYAFELIVVDDGSRDDTAALVLSVAQSSPSVQLHRLLPNRGKGAAVREGMLQSQGRYVFYVDADMNVAPSYLAPGLVALQSGSDLVVGTRRLMEYIQTERNLGRVVAGALYQLVRRTVTLHSIKDTQCGFKGMGHDLATCIFQVATISSFAFDVEVLFLAQKFHGRITELPVSVVYRAGSTVKWRKQLLPALLDVVRIRVNDLRGRYD